MDAQRLGRRRHVSRAPSRLSRRHRWTLYASCAALLLSGALWLLARYALRSHGEFGELPHPAEALSMRVHGAAVLVFLVAFGALLPGHAIDNWRRRHNRGSGGVMVVVVLLLTLSGYGLYYAGDERLRSVVSVGHWVIGVASCAALVTHIIFGERTRALARQRHAHRRAERRGAPAAVR